MKIDINEVKKSGNSLEEVLALLNIEMTRVGQILPYTSVTQEQILEMTAQGLLEMAPAGIKLTTTGKKLILTIIGGKQPSKTAVNLNFAEFWEAFPTTDRHGIWLRTRSPRSDKERSEKMYNMAVINGTPHSELIRALQWEVEERKVKSISSNRMSYMKASASWLNQKEYEIILEEISNNGGEEAPSTKDWTTSLI